MKITPIAFGLIPFCLAGFVAEARPADLPGNGGFERDPLGPLSGKVPAGWARSYGDPAVLRIVDEPRPGSPGDKALKIGTNEKNKRGGVLSKPIPLDPKFPLEVFLWLKDGGDMKVKRQPYVGVAWYDAQRKPIIRVPNTKCNYIYLNFPRQPDWQLVLRPFREGEKDGTKRYYSIPSNAAFFELWIFVQGYPWPIWVDDVEVVQAKPATQKK